MTNHRFNLLHMYFAKQTTVVGLSSALDSRFDWLKRHTEFRDSSGAAQWDP